MTEPRETGPSWDRVKQIFHEVLEARPAERGRLLEVLSGEDGLLKAKVQALLDADAEAADFLDSPTVGDAARRVAAATPAEAPGQRIGPYKLLQQIGEGGFGVVYMAEQEEPIQRRVALKVIKPGMDTKQVIARFEAERQALAMLDHPNIAKVLDAGSTPAGRPYFVMELVRGIPITDYCDEQKLGTKERLQLFAQVCGAVHHAHEQGIIHRDLKPSNVMVTLHDGTAVPKVIDFGVAKAIRQKLTKTTLFTEFNQFIGTPEYMAPEQASYEGLDVDRRSDVYSLGALLYELLTGTTPFENRTLRRAAQLEVLRILKEEEPPRPSNRVLTRGADSEMAARHRQVDVQALTRLLRGDLDWIVMKAIEKDRRRRYGSAAEVAADITRYFEQRPIEARPPSVGYRLQKLVRRRRGPLAVAAVVALLVAANVAWVGRQRSRLAATEAASAAPPLDELLATTEADDESCFYDGHPSPDGTRILYVDWCDGDVFLRDLATGTSKRVTEYDFVDGVAWLPDGKRISVAPRGPFDAPTIIDLETGAREVPPRLAGLDLSPGDWSVDGEHLTGVLRGDGAVVSVLVSVNTGERRVIKEGSGPGRFSPDGRHVLFVDDPAGTRDLFVLEVETGERWVVVDGPDDQWNGFWAPDGSAVAYQTEEGLWIVPVADGRATGARPRLVGRAEINPRGWNRTGFFYTVFDPVNRAYRVGVEARSGRVTGPREPIPLPAGSPDPPKLRWSPDMERVAVARRNEEALHVVTDEATRSIPIPGHQPERIWWSASGDELLFSNLRGGRSVWGTAYAVDLESGRVREIFPDIADLARVHVDSDGGRALGVRYAGGPDVVEFLAIVVLDLEEGSERVVAEPNEFGLLAGRADQPRFSPDGSWVLFSRMRGDEASPTGSRYSLWLVRPDGSDERLLVEVPFLIAAEWDPTSTMVAYQAVGAEGDTYLSAVSVDGEGSTSATHFDDLTEWRLVDWSPDGSWLTVREALGRWEFWVDRDPGRNVDEADPVGP